MKQWNRRTFLGTFSAAFVAACARPAISQASVPQITVDDRGIRVRTAHYAFTYSVKDDSCTIADSRSRVIFQSPLQPVVVVAPPTDASARHCVPGYPQPPVIKTDRVTFSYSSVNGNAKLYLPVRFSDEGFWFEPVQYESLTPEDVVSLNYFATVVDNVPVPALGPSFLATPGISMSTFISPVQILEEHADMTFSLGHSGSSYPGALVQQWALPVHFFYGWTAHGVGGGRKNEFTEGHTDTFVCGLADLPGGDFLFEIRAGRGSIWIDYRSDLWKHLRTPGKLTLGSTWCWSFGINDYEAIANYYAQLLQAGIIQRKQNSSAKNAAALSPQFCVWGTQTVRNRAGAKLDESFLNQIYGELKASGMQAAMFSIDDKWEGKYGTLEHDNRRFPHFEQFLDRVRAEGHRIGIWTAFMRCENPADLGLTLAHMLQTADGKPYSVGDEYYILDFTQPAVEKALIERARRFIRRYKPDLVKFDFGYEVPAVHIAAPHDKNWAGERILKRGLDIVVGAMCKENPDVVVMYYQLSPLFVQYFDLHSLDDLFLDAGDYDLEANRRLYYASLLGPLGVPTYGTSGYDWSSSSSIWFDSVASGTIGSLNDFAGDEFGEVSTPERIALYNGLTHTVRHGNLFTVVPFPAARPEAATRGAHARSWARIEGGKVTLIAQRPPLFDDGDSLVHQAVDARVDGLISTTVPVVVASKTSDAISNSNHLAVVPCGEGMATIRLRGRTAKIITHHFGGATVESTAEISKGKLTLALFRRDASSSPVEWMEIAIS
jgi:hypothetical protein